jgi:hypothetical protein
LKDLKSGPQQLGPLKGKKTPLMIDLKANSSIWTTEKEENSLHDRLESRQQQLDYRRGRKLYL